LKKVLVIRLSSIGDIVLTTPVIRCLKRQMPGVQVHYAVKKQFQAVVSANPFIDKVHIFDGDLNALADELKREGFDFVADLHKNFRSMYIRRTLKVPAAGFPKLNYKKWLYTKLKINFMPDLHIVDRYFRAVLPLGIKNDGQGLDYFIPAEDEVDIHTLPPGFEKGYIAFAIGAMHATKRLPEHKIIRICIGLDKPVVLLGGKDDADRGEAIASQAGDRVANYCGKLSINQSASLVRQADAVITHDTGLMHIAAAFRKNIVSVWGNTVPEFGMSPYMPENQERSTIVEVKGLSCRPCSKLGYDRCPKKHFRCMEEIEAEEVIKTVRR
jgi:ADP-heptose:LPS heptosyltransferase